MKKLLFALLLAPALLFSQQPKNIQVASGATFDENNIIIALPNGRAMTIPFTWNATNNTLEATGNITIGNIVVGGFAGATANGQIWIGNATNGLFTKNVITAGDGISITNAAGAITINATGSGAGDVTAASSFGTDNRLIKSDGTGKGVQSTGIAVDDSNNVSGIGNVTIDGLSTFNAATIVPAGTMGSTAINVAELTQVRTLTANETWTLSATPADETWFGWRVRSPTTGYTGTLPAGTWVSVGTDGTLTAITAVAVPANGLVNLTVCYDADTTTYYVYGYPYTASGGSGTVDTSGSPSSGQAAQFSDSNTITGVAVVGTGNYVKDTAPTIDAATLTGVVSKNGASQITRTATTGNAINIGLSNKQALTGNVTATFSATAPAERLFDIIYSADGTARTVTLPADVVDLNGDTLASVEVPANGYVHILFRSLGSDDYVAYVVRGSGDGATLADGDYGSVTVGSGGSSITIDAGAVGTTEIADDAVNYAKMQNVSAQYRTLGRISAGSGNVEELTPANVLTLMESGGTNVIIESEINSLAELNAIVGNTLFSAEATGQINALTSKTTPTTSDLLVIDDAAASNAKKKVTVDAVLAVNDARTKTLTNTTFDASATGNALKQYGYLVFSHPAVFGAGVTQQTTVTSPLYGQALFSNSADKATNYVEYVGIVPADIDTSVALTGRFTFILGGADTGDHEYEISMVDVAASAVYDGAPGDAVSLTYTADGSGADKDVQYAGAPDTLTGWASALAAGQYIRIRVARDGDNGNDGSTVNSYSGPLIIRYGSTQ